MIIYSSFIWNSPFFKTYIMKYRFIIDWYAQDKNSQNSASTSRVRSYTTCLRWIRTPNERCIACSHGRSAKNIKLLENYTNSSPTFSLYLWVVLQQEIDFERTLWLFASLEIRWCKFDSKMEEARIWETVLSILHS